MTSNTGRYSGHSHSVLRQESSFGERYKLKVLEIDKSHLNFQTLKFLHLHRPIPTTVATALDSTCINADGILQFGV
jgi:hypothetical protein